MGRTFACRHLDALVARDRIAQIVVEEPLPRAEQHGSDRDVEVSRRALWTGRSSSRSRIARLSGLPDPSHGTSASSHTSMRVGTL